MSRPGWGTGRHRPLSAAPERRGGGRLVRAGLSQPTRSARDWVGSGVHVHAKRPARQLLDVAADGVGHGRTITRLRVIRSTTSNRMFDKFLWTGAAYRNRTDDLRITRGMLPCRTAATCTNSTADSAGSTDSTGISWPLGPRAGPRQERYLAQKPPARRSSRFSQ